MKQSRIIELLRNSTADDDEFNDAVDSITGWVKAANDAKDTVDAAKARYDEMESQIAQLQDANKSLKARNYDLLIQLPADDTRQAAPITTSGVVAGLVTEEGEVVHIENLFTEVPEPGTPVSSDRTDTYTKEG